MSNAFGTTNKLTFSFGTLKGSGDGRRRIWVNYNGCFPISEEQLGWGEDDLGTALCALKTQTFLHREYRDKYYDLLKRLGDAGFILKEESEE